MAQNKNGFTVPEGAKEYTDTRSYFAVQVREPKEFPGALLRRITTLKGDVISEEVVVDVSPFGNGMWTVIYRGCFVIYPNDWTTNMLQVRSYRDFIRTHPEADTEEAEDVFWNTKGE